VGWRHRIDTSLCLAVANPPTQTYNMLAVGGSLPVSWTAGLKIRSFSFWCPENSFQTREYSKQYRKIWNSNAGFAIFSHPNPLQRSVGRGVGGGSFPVSWTAGLTINLGQTVDNCS